MKHIQAVELRMPFKRIEDQTLEEKVKYGLERGTPVVWVRLTDGSERPATPEEVEWLNARPSLLE
jgi:hypothetical protein